MAAEATTKDVRRRRNCKRLRYDDDEFARVTARWQDAGGKHTLARFLREDTLREYTPEDGAPPTRLELKENALQAQARFLGLAREEAFAWREIAALLGLPQEPRRAREELLRRVNAVSAGNLPAATERLPLLLASGT